MLDVTSMRGKILFLKKDCDNKKIIMSSKMVKSHLCSRLDVKWIGLKSVLRYELDKGQYFYLETYKFDSLLHGGYITSQYLYGTSSWQVFRGREARARDSYLACVEGK